MNRLVQINESLFNIVSSNLVVICDVHKQTNVNYHVDNTQYIFNFNN